MSESKKFEYVKCERIGVAVKLLGKPFDDKYDGKCVRDISEKSKISIMKVTKDRLKKTKELAKLDYELLEPFFVAKELEIVDDLDSDDEEGEEEEEEKLEIVDDLPKVSDKPKLAIQFRKGSPKPPATGKICIVMSSFAVNHEEKTVKPSLFFKECLVIFFCIEKNIVYIMAFITTEETFKMKIHVKRTVKCKGEKKKDILVLRKEQYYKLKKALKEHAEKLYPGRKVKLPL